jgi:hypothetical protein
MESEAQPDPKSEGFLRHIFGAFGLALLIYVSFYSCDRHLRLNKGPWEVSFITTNRAPALIISQAKAGISNVTVIALSESVPQGAGVVRFDSVQKPIPFGKVKFEDLTYLPGTVVFDLSGHEVELLPRTLIINKKEIPWRSGSTILLNPSEKLPEPPGPLRRKSLL